MSPIQIKSLFSILLLCTTSVGYASLKQYEVIAPKELNDFFFFEDQPWVENPKKIQFNALLTKNKVIVLHFWATSCPACIQELKEIEEVARSYINKPIHFIALSINDPHSGVLRNYFSRLEYRQLKPYHNPSGTRPAIKGLPTTLFFNKAGKLIGRFHGAAKWHSDTMKKFLEQLMYPPLEKKSQGLFQQWFAAFKNFFS